MLCADGGVRCCGSNAQRQCGGGEDIIACRELTLLAEMHATHCAVAVDCGREHCIALCRKWSDNDPVVLARRAAAADASGASDSGSAPGESDPAFADAFMPGRLLSSPESSEGGECILLPLHFVRILLTI